MNTPVSKKIEELQHKYKEAGNKRKLDLANALAWGYRTLRTPQGLELIAWNEPEFLERIIDEAEYERGGVATHLSCVTQKFRELWDKENLKEKVMEIKKG